MKYLDEQDVYLINGDEMRKILHALWMARTLSADLQADRIWEVNHLYLVSNPKDSLTYSIFKKWQWAGRKCREKAKEFE